ncbi:MAG: Xaa-Pro peptidase family protein [Candidatus Margulisbacteria bacterium]|nr:Xaa-Pro peptidase family protein [Candidatus Margulisiibacteriota bacterium]
MGLLYYYRSFLQKFRNEVNYAYSKSSLIKDKEEIENIRKACSITVQIFAKLIRQDLKPGKTEKELEQKIILYASELGADKDLAFKTIIGSGPHSSLVHSLPTTRTIRKGDIIQFDLGVKVKGYCADFSRVIYVGKKKKAPKKIKKLFKIVKKSQDLALDELKKKQPFFIVAQKVNKYFEKKKVQYHFLHSLGHGIGIEVHEYPRIVEDMDAKLLPKPGMVVTVEPGLYYPGKFGLRLEDTVLITAQGLEILTKFPRKLFI